jgi:hypothetical protein
MPTGPLLGSDPPEYQESHHGRYKTVWGPRERMARTRELLEWAIVRTLMQGRGTVDCTK